MKKNYLFLAVVLGTFTSFGQNLTQVVGKTQYVASSTPVKPINEAKAILWQNDFGTPADWSFAVNGTANHNWVIGTGAPAGSFPIGAIMSTTAANGFAKFDSDLLCGADGSQNSDVRLVTPVNLTANAAVQVTAQSFYRKFGTSSCWIIASTDGINWTEFEVNVGMASNASTANPAMISANVSSVVGGSATAYIGFRYKGGCDYAWMVDDVKIETLPDNDMSVDNVWAGDIQTDFEYSMVPVPQLKPLEVMAVISNAGSVAQTNIPVTIDVTLAGTNVHTETQMLNFPVGIVDTQLFVTTFTPTALGAYKVKVSVPADDVATNSADSVNISTTNYIYAHDTPGASIFRFDQDDETTMGNIFIMEADAVLHGAQVVLQTGTTVDEIKIEVWELPASGSVQAMTYVYEEFFDISGLTLGATPRNFKFSDEVNLTAGTGYVLAVRKEGGPSRIFFGGSNQGDDDFSTTCFGPFGTAGAINWFIGWGFSPAIRMNFDPSLSINDQLMLEGVSVYPNPSTGIVNVSNDLNVSNTITVTDLTGKVVASKVASSATTIDLSNAGTGIYLVEVSNANGKKVERVVIK